MINGSPIFMSCSRHKGGCEKVNIHVPRTPTTSLPSSFNDQICHAVIKTRTIKSMKPSTYSNTYQMKEQMGSFQGVDMCNTTKICDFGHNSY